MAEDNIYAVGIDVGGSYTDFVIMDIGKGTVIARAKARTTYHDIGIGLKEAMSKSLRPEYIENIRFVGLSTTLATNAILENKGGKVGVIMIGWEPNKDLLMDVSKLAIVPGGVTSEGKPLDYDEKDAVDAAKSMIPEVGCIVVSGKFASLDNSQEKRAKAAISSITDIPVISACEMANEIGAHERTNTAILNGMLFPIINSFLDGVISILKEYGIRDALIMMMKADGTMMKLEEVRLRPVETIMSGPAASIVGGLFLSHADNGIVVDVGSTSTDIACVRNGMLPLTKNGTAVFGKRTHIRTMNVHTIALGGDSHIYVNDKGVRIGPDRAIPFVVATEIHHNLPVLMRSHGISTFILPHKINRDLLDDMEVRIVDYVESNAPCMEKDVIRKFAPKLSNIRDKLHNLLKTGHLIYTAVTPTDIMVSQGVFSLGDRMVADEAVRFISSSVHLSSEEFIDMVERKIHQMVGHAIMDKLMLDRLGRPAKGEDMNLLLDSALECGPFRDFSVNVGLNMPIIGLGGPADRFLSGIGRLFSTKVIIPENNDVGNAAGTIGGKVSKTASAFIHPKKDGGYAVSCSFQQVYETMYIEDAMDYAKRSTKEYAEKLTLAENCTSLVSYIDIVGEDIGKVEDSENVIQVRARVSGDPIESLVGYRG